MKNYIQWSGQGKPPGRDPSRILKERKGQVSRGLGKDCSQEDTMAVASKGQAERHCTWKQIRSVAKTVKRSQGWIRRSNRENGKTEWQTPDPAPTPSSGSHLNFECI